MDVRIHRGAHEIGGNCVELRHDGATILLDLGKPLTAGRTDVVPLPDAIGLDGVGAPPLGVFVSHGHQDHWGLVPQLPTCVPVWVGKGAADVLRAARFWGAGGVDLREAGHLEHFVPIAVGPFTVTPYLADHSGFDAYSLLVEAGGQRLFYSGDLRGHGRKASLFKALIADPPRDVDAMLLEGTNLRPDGPSECTLSELDVERDLVATMKSCAGLVAVLGSAQNIDRLVTVYRAALRADRTLGVDLYTADIAAATDRESIPRPSTEWPRVKAYLPLRQRVRVKESGEFERTAKIKTFRLYDEDLAAGAGKTVLFGAYQSHVAHLLRAGLLKGGLVVWSMWDGYLTEPSGQRMKAALAAAGVPLLHHHTSGHATPADLRRLVDAVRPRVLVPIHTETPAAYAALTTGGVLAVGDGTWWTTEGAQ